jgi:CRP-like cAMP-binding protein
MTEISFWKVPKENVKQFLDENPDVLFNLLQRVYRGIDGLLSRMSYLMSGNAHTRLITELLIAAKRFGKKNNLDEYTFILSEKDLATQAGLTRETVSREMKVLKDRGLVTLQKTVLVVKDINKLEMELSRF